MVADPGSPAGRPDLVGLSIDAVASVRPEEVAGPEGRARQVALVEAVPVLKSCDIVTRASAGGALERLLEGIEGCNGLHRRSRMNGAHRLPVGQGG
jgi:hypothetical protein